jgi:hypothetical protein
VRLGDSQRCPWKSTSTGFVTVKSAEPKDIDVVIDISQLDLRDQTVLVAIRPLLDQPALRTGQGLDVYAMHPGIGPNDLRRFFSYVKPEQRAALGLPDSFRKGLLRVAL